MKSKLLTLFTLVLVGISSCYDDSDLRTQLEDHEQRISALETLCNQLNTNISSLQTIVDALKNNDHVSAILPIKEGDKIVGYTISFANGGDITIYNGKDGEDGEAAVCPVIGAKKDIDGVYYWTIDGKWLTDDAGNKIAVTGKNGEDGKDAVAPVLMVKDGYWWISYDGEKTWNKLDYKVEDGLIQADPLFTEINQDDDTVTFTLADGTTIVLNKVNAFDVIFAQTKDILVEDEETLIIPFKVEGATAEVTVECMVSDESLRASAYMTSADEGEVKVKINWFSDYTDTKVLVFISNGNQQVIVKALTFEEKQFKSVQDAYKVPYYGGTFDVALTTNMEYDVIIPEGAQSWISLVETKAVRTDVLQFDVKPMADGDSRTTDIVIKSKDATRSQTITVVQFTFIEFADPIIEKQCLDAFDTNNDRKLSCMEAASVTDLGEMVLNYKNFVSFNELKYFTSIAKIPSQYFRDCFNLKEIEIPSSVTSIGDYAFSGCYSLTSIEIPSSVTTIGHSAFEDCSSLTSVEIPSSVTSIGNDAFFSCYSLTSIEIPSSVTTIGNYAFMDCSSLTTVEIPSSVTSIGYYAFSGCSGLTSIVVNSGNTVYDSRDNCNGIIKTASNTFISGCKNSFIPSSVTSIGDWAFGYCSSLTSIKIPSSVTTIGNYAFMYCSSLTTVEIPSSVTSIGYGTFKGCSSLGIIEIPSSVTSIGHGTFEGCSSLGIIKIPSSVTSIGDYAFNDCGSLTLIEIPSSVTSIGDYAFSGCSSLPLIEIPSSVTLIGDWAFGDCSSLTSIKIPSSVTSIGNEVFYECI